jgi:hypothetical protein
MATMTFPIQELELSVRVGTDRARTEAEVVKFYSDARELKPVWMTLKYGLTALLLKFMLASLARHQRLLIRAYQGMNFSGFSSGELVKWSESLDKIVDRGRPTLDKLEKFGPKTQKLWGNVLSDLSEQLDHMESIAYSLRSSANTDVSLLMAAAIDHMAANVTTDMAAD